MSKFDSSSDTLDPSDDDFLDLVPLFNASMMPILMVHLSVIGEDDIKEWRSKYFLPSSFTF